ncbi:MAG: hypothetical protein IJI46_06680 [Erysipelotrichaceae bacterium]|nr:hypothetical protein [Erysipelotrichaceae bacterium]
MLLVNNVKLELGRDEKDLKKILEKRLRHPVKSYQIKKRSLDARKQPFYVYSLLVEIDNEEKYLGKDISLYEKEDLDPPYKVRNATCIVAGYGPSGIFAAYRLCQAGFKVKVFEKGKRIKEREKDVETFFKKGILSEESNVQFGEGGAGTFSDAKLTTRIKDKYIDYILDIFIKHGANAAIRYENHAHIGTDEVRVIIEKITDHLIEKGVEFHFAEAMEEILFDEDRKIYGIKTNKGEYTCDHLLIGIGHSAYQSVMMLKEKGVFIEKKDIAIGFRVEHLQSLIDQRQTKGLVESANEYFLRYKGEKGVYSFCMCPGGIVIPAMSDKNTIVTNGMSYAARDSMIANSAILIQIYKEEFADGYEYLQNIERMAYDHSKSYRALSQNIADFMKGDLNPLIFDSTYPLGTVLYDFNQFFKKDDLMIVKEALKDFDRKIPGFIDQGIMVGPETRSSCPVRIKRDETYQSINTKELYPMGEGAGYGGGIMSCALDGIRIANALILRYEQI